MGSGTKHNPPNSLAHQIYSLAATGSHNTSALLNLNFITVTMFYLFSFPLINVGDDSDAQNIANNQPPSAQTEREIHL